MAAAGHRDDFLEIRLGDFDRQMQEALNAFAGDRHAQKISADAKRDHRLGWRKRHAREFSRFVGKRVEERDSDEIFPGEIAGYRIFTAAVIGGFLLKLTAAFRAF